MGQDEPLGGVGSAVAGSRPGVLVCVLVAALVLTDGQGPLSEFMAPGPDPGLQGGPRRGQANSLPQTLPPPSLPGMPRCPRNSQ